MHPVIHGHIFMQMIFLSRRPLSPSFCLRCLSADKRKRMPILFCLPRGFFFFSFCCHRRPEFIATFVFSRPPLTPSSHRPALPFDGCCRVKMVWCGCNGLCELCRLRIWSHLAETVRAHTKKCQQLCTYTSTSAQLSIYVREELHVSGWGSQKKRPKKAWQDSIIRCLGTVTIMPQKTS